MMMVHPLRNPTSTKQVLRILDEPPLIEHYNGGDPSLQQSYDPPWIAIIVTSKVTKIIGLHQQGRPMLSSEMNHLSNNISIKFWYEGWRWLRSYQFETFVGVSTVDIQYTVHTVIRQRGYTTINWWRHTIRKCCCVELRICKSMGGKISLSWWLADSEWREREDSISTRQSTTMERHNNILIGYCNSWEVDAE